MADEPEREVIVTNGGGGGGGGVIAAVVLLIVVVVVLFFVFGRGMLGGGTDKIEADGQGRHAVQLTGSGAPERSGAPPATCPSRAMVRRSNAAGSGEAPAGGATALERFLLVRSDHVLAHEALRFGDQRLGAVDAFPNLRLDLVNRDVCVVHLFPSTRYGPRNGFAANNLDRNQEFHWIGRRT